ncbi:MAG: PA4642 family protein [Pseudomonadales bacterium]|nr:PA4642 family protein [Pseudomonadales bacterium]MCC6529561.1 PA4642 family protein [Pseudomonadales bacterium]MCP5332752.1 PA4642 family protein [Pseudomonadales bacterium]HNL24300.1 PA4642 family protein [Pseudomonadales bacterium]
MTTTPPKRKDKKAVIGQSWSDEHLRSLLDLQPPAGLSADHHRLLQAYRSMIAEDFSRFIGHFIAAGHDLDATDPRGQSVARIIAGHPKGEEYLIALRQAGARMTD